MNNEPFDNPNQALFETPINLRHYWHIILERRWLVITSFICVLILSLIYLFRATPIYQATTQIEIKRESDNVLQMGAFSFETREQDYLQTQYKKLRSRSLIELVVNDLSLQQDERYAESIDPIKAVLNDVDVAPIRLSRLVDIKAQHPNPRVAADIANSVATNFIAMHLEQKRKANMDVVKLLEEEVIDQQKKVENHQKKLNAYLEEHGVLSFEDADNLILQALLQHQAEFDKAVSEAASARTIIREVDGLLEQRVPLESIPPVRENPEIQALQKEMALLQAGFAELRERYQDHHPLISRAEHRIFALETAIRQQADTLVKSLRNKAHIAQAKERELGLVLKDREEKQRKLKGLKVQYEVLKRDADSSTLLYNAVLAGVKERELTANNMVNNMQVVDLAEVPYKPIKPRVVLTLFLGVFGGLAVSIGLAFFVNYLDDSVKSQEDVESFLRLPFLGYVPNIKTNSVVERDLQAHLHPQSNAAEGFRTIRATISLTHKSEKFRIISVTSTIPSEGKSLIASNLAIVTAQTGLRTLLVDADLRRPSVHKAYQLHSPQGLSSFLMEDLKSFEPMVHKTEVSNLDVICCGAVPSNPSELIGSNRMMAFLAQAGERYDRIVLDCPPISAVSDPLIISAMSDGVVFVSKFNKIRREHALKSVQRLQNAGIHIMGVVLNDIDFEGKDSYYYSYYYYQNRYYASHYKTTPTDGTSKKTVAEVSKTRNGS
jgi:polysaccharide biosynthesis transport protein